MPEKLSQTVQIYIRMKNEPLIEFGRKKRILIDKNDSKKAKIISSGLEIKKCKDKWIYEPK